MPTTAAIVIGGVDHGESNRIVHLLTPRGRLSVFAPGARRSKRRFAGALEPFQTIEVELHASGGRRGGPSGLVTAISARVVRPRLGLREHLERIALASYAAELCSRIAPEGEATDAYSLLSALFDELESSDPDVATRRAFEVRLIAALGYEPQLAACVACGRVEPPFRVDFEAGGVVCVGCGDHGTRIGPGTHAWLRAVSGAGAFDPRGPHPPEDAARAARTAGPAIDRFYAQLVSAPLRSRALLSELGL